jgi:signal transduction histidine kinase
MQQGRITQRTVLRILIGGFALVIILLIVASIVGVRNTQSIESMTARLVEEQNLTARLINEIQLEQSTLNALSYALAQTSGGAERIRLLKELDETVADFSRIVNAARGTPEGQLWADLRQSVGAFAEKARQVIADGSVDATERRDLFHTHEAVIRQASRLVSASSSKTMALEGLITERSRELVNGSVVLLGSCIFLAMICAFLTVRVTTDSLRKLEFQASELSRVSWHMLEGQEAAARRFSHELHDELGQSLAAVRANLIALSPSNWKARQADTLHLVDEAISNVRELSQLLRPVILDDFGLDASLRWLAEKFTQRTNIVVDYDSNVPDRLSEDTETHLFRIAQEALTNVARHSGATKVRIHLSQRNGSIMLRISDDGKGMKTEVQSAGLGMVGIRARARHAGGEMSLSSEAGKGLTIEVTVPRTASQESHESGKKDTHPVGR